MAKILIIDDDGIVRDALVIFLSKKNHEVLLSGDGINGLLIFKNSKPDLVILDRNIPNMTGSRVLAEMKKISPKIPIIILTAYDSDTDAENYLNSGAASFLSKGEGLSSVIKEVEKILGASGEGNKSSVEKILIVDDDKSMIKMLARFLLSKDFEVLSSFDGVSGIDMYKKHKPNLVLLDIGLPDKSGLEVLKDLKSFDDDAAIIMVTGNDDADIGRQCLKAGAVDYISKPINLSTLERSIKTILYINKPEL